MTTIEPSNNIVPTVPYVDVMTEEELIEYYTPSTDPEDMKDAELLEFLNQRVDELLEEYPNDDN
jgi:hypothetical protein